MATDFQVRVEQKRRLFLLRMLVEKPERLQEYIRLTETEMTEEDVAIVEKQVLLEVESGKQ